LTTGSWKPKVHFIWDIILDMYLGADAKKASLKDKAAFQEFYRITVDGERIDGRWKRVYTYAKFRRNPFRANFYAPEEILGFRGRFQGVAFVVGRDAAVHLHSKLHEVLDEPPVG
jgi:hypothetical protein